MNTTGHPVSTAPPGSGPGSPPHEVAPPRPSRAALRSSLSCVVCLAVARVFARVAAAGWPAGAAARVDDIVLALLASAGLLCALWLALGTALAALGALPGIVGRASAAVAERITPRLVKQALGIALGASVGTLALPAGAVAGVLPGPAPTAPSTPVPDPGYHPTTALPTLPVGTTDLAASRARPAHATPTPTQTTTAVTTDAPTTDALPGPGWRPTRPAPVLDPRRSTLLAPPPRLQTATVEHVTVRRGDTLWSIAARHLGPEATDAEIAREWPRWYAANTEAVGDDPDSIRPGTQLVAPQVLAR